MPHPRPFGSIRAGLGLLLAAASFPASGQLVRQHPTSLALPASLPAASGYTLENALGTLTFSQPVAIVTPPGETGRLFVVEKNGRVQVVRLTGTGAPAKSQFLDVRDIAGVGSGTTTNFMEDGESGLLGLAFHPDYASNRTFFILYTVRVGGNRHQRLARIQASTTNPDLAAPATHLPLITQRDEASNHNGGDLHFGPDGYLYVSTGDEGGGGDGLNNARWIDRDFHSAILRLDVDRRNVGQPGGSVEPNPHPAIDRDTSAAPARYAVPPDNPLVVTKYAGTTGPIGAGAFGGGNLVAEKIRTEFAIYGLRNPWRMSFDRPTGRLFIADVGQSAREEISLVPLGGLGVSLGWPYREGTIAFSGAPTPVPGAPRQEPIHDYDRTVGSSITGGVVYRGTRLPELYERYLFADYGSGRIFALRRTDAGAWTRTTLVSSGATVAGIGVDPRNGDALFGNIASGVISRLARSGTTGTAPPATLLATGAFANLAALTPSTGVVPYDINLPFWSDHALKRRWFAFPGPPPTGGTAPTATFAAEGAWTFPTGTVWVKHFDLEATRGQPATAFRLETRFIVKTSEGAYGLSYRWRADQSEADLVPEEGADADYTVNVNGVDETIRWRFPSRNECSACHTPAAGHALSFNTRQLNRLRTYGAASDNQLNHLRQAGYLSAASAPSRETIPTLPAHAALDDASQSLEHRVRGYLAVNCVSCHVPGGAALGNFDVRPALGTDATGLLSASLINPAGDPTARPLVPGDAARSMILRRILGNGVPRMPPLASNQIDREAESLLRAYVAELADRPTFALWQAEIFGSPPPADAAPEADPDGDGATNRMEFLAGTSPLVPGASGVPLAVGRDAGGWRLEFTAPAGRSAVVETSTDLVTWTRWELPENLATTYPAADTPRVLTGGDAAAEARRFFRLRLDAR